MERCWPSQPGAAKKNQKLKSIYLGVSRPLGLFWFHLSFLAKFLLKNSNLVTVEPRKKFYTLCRGKIEQEPTEARCGGGGEPGPQKCC